MSDNGLRDYEGYHVTWCTNYDTEFTEHEPEEPYCSKQITGIRLVPADGMVTTTAWVSPTRAFTHGRFTPAEHVEREARYNGVEIALDHWAGPGDYSTDEQKIRMSGDAARSLAAALVRAADIEQGLTR
ncbi:hypothetical protein H7J51_05365 [Mycobacterium crocinum]|uniref:Uncharacterized protein n=1 Tax=Mycolicibacterium crocinum TaxID=388459 RepID=A0ABY3TR27_9MYCO|nr:hypothetical protein [Mycolicibacterium crocinum]MCV7214713.1 hypothetical protein [Mycolicibacterium crocinum]ULN41600.1 hypothetical protein MI149_00075 [Mycolicibacterium crocinum]